MSGQTTDVNVGGMLGKVIYWSIGSARAVPVAEVQAQLKAAGLEEKWAYDVDKKNAFIRAVRAAEEGRIVRRVEETGKAITFQFTQEFLKAQRLEYAFEAQATYDKERGTVSCTSTAVEALVAGHLDHASLHYLPRDITSLIQRIFKKEADLLPLRERGAVYFVPARWADLVNRVQAFLTSINVSLEALTVSDANGTKGSIGKAFLDEMNADLDALNAQIHEVEQTPEDDLNQRSVTMRLTRVKKMMARTRTYEELLSMKATELREALEKAQARLRAKLEVL